MDLTSFCASIVLSPFGRCSSSARTTQLAMMVSRTVYSKGGHSIRNLVVLRMMFFSERINSELGPVSRLGSLGPPTPPTPAPWPRRFPPMMSWRPDARPDLAVFCCSSAAPAFSRARLACSAAASLNKKKENVKMLFYIGPRYFIYLLAHIVIEINSQLPI